MVPYLGSRESGEFWWVCGRWKRLWRVAPERGSKVQNNERCGAIPKRGYKVGEAAHFLGVAPQSVRRLIARGLLKPSRVLRHILIPVEQLEALLVEDGR